MHGELPPADDFLTAEEIAERCNFSAHHARRLMRDGVLPSVRFGKLVRVPRRAFERWVADHLTGGEP